MLFAKTLENNVQKVSYVLSQLKNRVKNSILEHKDGDGNQITHLSVKLGLRRLFSALTDSGVNFGTHNGIGATPLMMALFYSRHGMAEQLC